MNEKGFQMMEFGLEVIVLSPCDEFFADEIKGGVNNTRVSLEGASELDWLTSVQCATGTWVILRGGCTDHMAVL
jgi:hypothetical protein